MITLISKQISIILLLWSVKVVNCHQKYPPVPFSVLATCQEFTFDTQDCQHYFPIENLKNYPSDKYKVQVKFYVMAEYDAYIILTDSTKDPRLEYKAVIGERINTLNHLRKTNASDYPQAMNNHQQILHLLWPVPIVITQSICGDLAISIPNVAEPLLELPAPDLNVNFICVFGWNHRSRWFYNCKEEEDFLLNKTLDCSHNNPSKRKTSVIGKF